MTRTLKICFIVGLLLIGAGGLAYVTQGEEPTWIQYSEPLAGANSPNFTDVLNRPAQTIWNNFLIEHDSDGYHNYSALAAGLNLPLKVDDSIFEIEHNPDGSHTFEIPGDTDDIEEATNLYYTESRVSSNTDVLANTAHRQTTTGNPHSLDAADVGAVSSSTFLVEHNADGTHNFTIPNPSEFAITGNGVDSIARAEFSPTGLQNSSFSAWGIVTITRLDTAEMIYSWLETEYLSIIMSFEKSSTNNLEFYLGSGSVTSTLTFDATHLNRPVEIGVSYDVSTQNVFFWIDGQTDAAQTITPVYPSINMMESHRIGEGFQGDVLTLSLSNKVVFSPSSWHTPLSEGLSQCIGCLAHYTMDEQSGSTLSDSMGTYDLTVYGTWTEYSGGY